MVSIENFGRNIKKRRSNLGIPQYELAERLDISPNCKLCTELNVPPDYLMLGSMRSNNVPQNIVDKLKLCSSDTLYTVDGIIDVLIEKQDRQR